jgi:hypothetical protein
MKRSRRSEVEDEDEAYVRTVRSLLVVVEVNLGDYLGNKSN